MPNRLILGTVDAKSANLLDVVLDGSTASTPVVDCCGADVASRVVCAFHGTQLLAIALVGGQPAPQIAADYITESGTANGWHYDLYASGHIRAWGEFSITWSAANNWYLTVSTPKTMANADYIPTAQISSWRVDQCYAGLRTTTQFKVGVTASGGGDTGTVWLTLDGFAA